MNCWIDTQLLLSMTKSTRFWYAIVFGERPSDEAKPSDLITWRILNVLWVLISQSEDKLVKAEISGKWMYIRNSQIQFACSSACQISYLSNYLSFFEKLLFCGKYEFEFGKILRSVTPPSPCWQEPKNFTQSPSADNDRTWNKFRPISTALYAVVYDSSFI